MDCVLERKRRERVEMVKTVSGSFVKDSIYGYVRDEKRKLEVTSVAGDMAGNNPKPPHFLFLL